MSDYHVLETGVRIRAILHYPIPGGWTNQAGLDARTCLTQDPAHPNRNPDTGNIESKIPGLAGQELTDLLAGDLIEVEASIRDHPAHTNTQRQAAMDAIWIAGSTTEFAKIQNRYQFWGFTRDVP